jgi:hypothetical protein
MQQSADFIHSLQIFSSLFSGSEHWHNAHSFFTCASFRFSVTNMITYEKEYLNSSVNLLNSSYRNIINKVCCKQSHTYTIKQSVGSMDLYVLLI